MQLPNGATDPLRRWLARDPVGWAHVTHLAFGNPEEVAIHVDDPQRPRSVVVHHAGRNRLVVASERPEALVPVLEELPDGEYGLSSVDLAFVPALEEILDVELNTPVWLFRLDPDRFRPHAVVETEPVRAEDAPIIAEHWNPERDAVDYVRGRIREGITSAIYRGGEPVAWDMTHFETDTVVMLGFLHVREPWRGKGYAKTVTTANVRKVLARGKIPCAQVFQDNEVSLNLTESMGFVRVKQQAWGQARKG